MISKEYVQLVGPFLIVALVVFSINSAGKIRFNNNLWNSMVIFILSAIISFASIFNLSLAEYILSFNPNFSIGSLTLIIILLMPYVVNHTILEEKYVILFCLWNVLSSLILFLSCLGLLPFDLYAWGYAFSPGFLIMAVITVSLVWAAPPLAIIFLAYMVAFDLKILPSDNLFDYITDGFLFLLSAAMLTGAAVRWRRSEGRGAGKSISA